MTNRTTRRQRAAPAGAKGFRVPPKRIATLKFSDGDYEGAVVECSLDASVGVYLELTKDEGDTSFDAVAAQYRRFGREILLSWNVVDGEGEPMPATAEGMLQVPSPFARAVMSAWVDALVGVNAPLEVPSNDGSTSAAG